MSGAGQLFRGRRKPGEMSPRYRLFRRTMIRICRLLFGYTLHGGERVPAEGPLVIASNHGQYADPVLVCVAVPRRVQWMGKKELFTFPFRTFFRIIGTFPVDREGGGRAAIRAALAFLAEGWALGIFPEGTHRGEAGSKQAKSGVVVLASRGNAPILPVYVGKLPGPLGRLRGRRLHIYVGEPIELDPALRGGASYREKAEEIMRSIYELPRFGRADTP
jgi:1-acyl-sn-glycerol-3-phosphate acyltransferase